MITGAISVISPPAGIVAPGTAVPAGPTGADAYGIAVQNGFTGTVLEWLASLKGDTGDPGPANLIVGSGAPTPAIGLDGQVYIDAALGAFYGPRAGGEWGAPKQLVQLLTGAAAPGTGTGVPGQYFLDGQNRALYGPKVGTSWGSPALLVPLLIGAGPPADSLGLNGQLFLDPGSRLLYGPKASGTWPAGVSLVGPAVLGALAPWQTATAYVAGPPASYVSQGGSSYACLVSHTSGTFATDLAAGRWGLVAQSGAVLPSGTVADGEVAVFVGTSGNTIRSGGPFVGNPLDASPVLPTLDYRLTTSDCVPSDQFSRLSAGYRTRASGLLESVAAGVLRVDHDANGVNLGALLEEARTNSWLQSDALDNAATLKSNTTISANGAVGSDGAATLDKIVSASGTLSMDVSQAVTGLGAANPVSFSVEVKAAEHTNVRLAIAETSPFARYGYADFNLSTGAVVRTGTAGGAAIVGSPTIQPLANGSYRCSLSVLPGGSATGAIAKVILNTGADSFTIVGNGSSGIYAGKVQMEAGNFPTSYIPTTTAAVTRAADSLVVPVTSEWFNSVEGTFYVEGTAAPGVGSVSQAVLEVNDGTANNRLVIYRDTGRVLNVQVNVSATAYAVVLGTVADGASFKVAVAVYGTTLVASLNGGTPVSTTISGVPTGQTSLLIGNAVTGRPWNGWIKRAAYVARKQSNTILQRLTA